MTAHELAKKLMDGPDVEVCIEDAEECYERMNTVELTKVYGKDYTPEQVVMLS